MGLFSKCCCCFTKQVSTTICTVIILLYTLYTIVSNAKDLKNGNFITGNDKMNEQYANTITPLAIIELVAEIIASILLICLLVGIFMQEKVSLMKPFEYGYPVYLVYYLCSLIYSFIFINKINNTAVDELSNENGSKLTVEEERAKHDMYNKATGIAIVFSVIIYLLYVFYYLTTRSYIKECEKDRELEKEARILESVRQIVESH